MSGNVEQIRTITDEIGKSIIKSLTEDGRLAKPEDKHWWKHPATGWIVALLCFFALTVFDDLRGGGTANAKTLQEMEVRLATIEARLTTLTSQADAAGRDRYTSSDAVRDKEAQALRDTRQNARIEKLEARVMQ